MQDRSGSDERSKPQLPPLRMGVQWTPPDPSLQTKPGKKPGTKRCDFNGKHAFVISIALLNLQALLTVLLPLVTGRVLFLDLVSNPCGSFVPGNIRHAGNFGPRYLYPHDCANVLT